MRRTGGHTLVELLVVLTVMSMITTAVVVMYKNAVNLFQMSSSKINLQSRAREAIKRIGPIVVSGVRPDQASSSAIMLPALMGEANATDSVVFSTTEDYLMAPSVGPPANRCALWTTIPSPITQFYYRIRVDTAGSSALILEKVTRSGNTYTAVANLNPRALLRGEKGKAILKEIRFTRLTLNALRVRLTVGTNRYQTSKAMDYTGESIIQMPAVNP